MVYKCLSWKIHPKNWWFGSSLHTFLAIMLFWHKVIEGDWVCTVSNWRPSWAGKPVLLESVSGTIRKRALSITTYFHEKWDNQKFMAKGQGYVCIHPGRQTCFQQLYNDHQWPMCREAIMSCSIVPLTIVRCDAGRLPSWSPSSAPLKVFEKTRLRNVVQRKFDTMLRILRLRAGDWLWGYIYI